MVLFYDEAKDPPIYPNKPKENILICHIEGFLYYVNPRTYRNIELKMALHIIFNSDLTIKQFKQDKMVTPSGGIDGIKDFYAELIDRNHLEYGGYINVIYPDDIVSRLNPRYHRLTQEKAIHKMIKEVHALYA